MVAQVLEMRLQLAPGYEADLAQLYGTGIERLTPD